MRTSYVRNKQNYNMSYNEKYSYGNVNDVGFVNE